MQRQLGFRSEIKSAARNHGGRRPHTAPHQDRTQVKEAKTHCLKLDYFVFESQLNKHNRNFRSLSLMLFRFCRLRRWLFARLAFVFPRESRQAR